MVQAFLDRFRESARAGPEEDREILESMIQHEQAILPVETKGMDWQHYFGRIHLPGLNRYALRPKAVKLSRGKVRMARSPVGAEL